MSYFLWSFNPSLSKGNPIALLCFVAQAVLTVPLLFLSSSIVTRLHVPDLTWCFAHASRIPWDSPLNSLARLMQIASLDSIKTICVETRYIKEHDAAKWPINLQENVISWPIRPPTPFRLSCYITNCGNFGKYCIT